MGEADIPLKPNELEGLGVAVMANLSKTSRSSSDEDDDEENFLLLKRIYLALKQGGIKPPPDTTVPWTMMFASHMVCQGVEMLLSLKCCQNEMIEFYGSALYTAATKGAKGCTELILKDGGNSNINRSKLRFLSFSSSDQEDSCSSILHAVLFAMRDDNHKKEIREREAAFVASEAEASKREETESEATEPLHGGNQSCENESGEKITLVKESVDYRGVVDVMLRHRVKVGREEALVAIDVGAMKVVARALHTRALTQSEFKSILSSKFQQGEIITITQLVTLLEELGNAAVCSLPVGLYPADTQCPPQQLGGKVSSSFSSSKDIPIELFCFEAMTNGFALSPTENKVIIPSTDTTVPWTLLFAAHRRPKAVEFAHANIRNSDGDMLAEAEDFSDEKQRAHGSALTIASINGGKACVELLLKYGANPNAVYRPYPRGMVSMSILQSVLLIIARGIMKHVSSPTSEDDNDDELTSLAPQEARDHEGVLDSLLRGGARVGLVEAKLAIEAGSISVLHAAIQSDTLDLTELIPTAIFKGDNGDRDGGVEGGGATNLLDLLLQNGANPNGAIDAVPFPDGTPMTLLEGAIQAGNVKAFKMLLTAADGTAAGAGCSTLLKHSVLNRLLTFPCGEHMLQAIEDELIKQEGGSLEKAKARALSSLQTQKFEMTSGYAWVGNMPDFERLLHERENKDARNSEYNRTQYISFHKVRKGRWFVFATPVMQVAIHEDCPEDYIAGTVTGAIYGGFKQDEWNLLYPSVSEIQFTGRMVYSEEDPRHVTCFMDPQAFENLDCIRAAPIPDFNVLSNLQRLSVSGVLTNCAMWTSMQEYRYGLMAGGQCFVSIGYEGMDLDVQLIAPILDGIMRAKMHCKSVDTSNLGATNGRKVFVRSRYNDSKNVPPKRTPLDIFEGKLKDGEQFTGLEFIRKSYDMRGEDFPPPRESLTSFSEQNDGSFYRESEDLKPFLLKFKTEIAAPLVQPFFSLIDESMKMFLHSKIIPAVASATIAAGENSREEKGKDENDDNDDNLQSVILAIANAAFPNHAHSPSVHSFCYSLLSKPFHDDDSTPFDTPAEWNATATTDMEVSTKETFDVNEENLRTQKLRERIRDFLLARVSEFNEKRLLFVDDGSGSGEEEFVKRLQLVCDWLVNELLESCDRVRRDCYYPVLVPGCIRMALSNDMELWETFHVNELAEFFYPS